MKRPLGTKRPVDLKLLFHAAEFGHEYFIRAFTKRVQTRLTLKNLRKKSRSGAFKGKSLLDIIVQMALDNNNKPFSDIWNKFKHQLTLEDLRSISKPEGSSLFWKITCLASKNYPEPFEFIYAKFKNQFNADDLRNTDSKIRMSIYYLIICAFSDTSYFENIWPEIADGFTLEDVLQTAIDSKAQGSNVLWLLAQMCTFGKPQPFIYIWNKFHDRFSADDLKTPPNEHLLSIIGSIIFAALKHENHELNTIVLNILRQMPGILSDEDLDLQVQGSNKSIRKIIESHPNSRMFPFISLIIAKRNNLFNELRSGNNGKKHIHCAIEAEKAGYINAYYDAGMFCFDKKQYLLAYQSFRRSPQGAKQFKQTPINKVFLMNAVILLFKRAAHQELDPNKRKIYLDAALWFTLQFTDTNQKLRYLQMIAELHVTKSCDIHNRDMTFIDMHIALCLTSTSSLDSCYKIFEYLYDYKKRLTQKEQLTARLKFGC